ncbi:MAG: hypothetical protein II399_09815 [Lachnospiraceae bacterium]|nr:hypothetical protein [Lachnospiraceae bacterium]
MKFIRLIVVLLMNLLLSASQPTAEPVESYVPPNLATVVADTYDEPLEYSGDDIHSILVSFSGACRHLNSPRHVDSKCCHVISREYVCAECGETVIDEELFISHSLKYYETVAPTYESDGYDIYKCSFCGTEIRYNVVPKLVNKCLLGEHEYVDVVTAPTCNSQGYTVHTCSECGESYTDSYLPALSHEYGEWGLVKAPTCAYAGSEKRTCSLCGYSETRPVAKLAHEYTCVVTDSTCSKVGYKTYTCSCGHSYKEEIAKKSHSFEFDKTVAPTLSAEGYDLYVCSVCGATEKRNVTPKLEEAYKTDKCTMIDLTMAVYDLGVDAVPAEPFADVKTSSYTNSEGRVFTSKYYTMNFDTSKSNLLKQFLLDYIATLDTYSFDNTSYFLFTDGTAYSGIGEEYEEWIRTEHAAFVHVGGLNSLYGARMSWITYRLYDEEYEGRLQYMISWAGDVVKELGINKNMTQYEAIDILNNWLGDYMMYSYSDPIHDPYQGLIEKRGVCMVYSILFQLLCQKCGIKCYYEVNEDLNHAFNYIVFSDGSKKYIDTTWNDPTLKKSPQYEPENYPRLTAAQKYKYRHEYFLMDYDPFIKKHYK